MINYDQGHSEVNVQFVLAMSHELPNSLEKDGDIAINVKLTFDLIVTFTFMSKL